MQNPINISNSNNLAPFLAYFEQKGIEWRKIAAEYDFPEDIEDREYWLSSHQAMAFLGAMVKQTNKNVGFDVGRLITLDQISPELVSEFSGCENLEHALHHLLEMMPTLNNYMVVWVDKIDGKWYLCHRGSYHPSLPGYDQAEWFRTFAFISLCRMFLGHHWEPNSVFMSFPDHLARDVTNTANLDAFHFDHAFGAIEVPLSADFVPVDKPIDSDWLTVITALVQTYAVLPWFNIQWLASLIGTSSRSLQRQFTDHGCTFRGLRDEARCQVAKRLLKANTSPFETAWRCGYSDLSNFNRAFKGWLGKTPAQYQKQTS
ncbi:AraC family transcriptional regulator [Vibrio sp. 1CM2L]|uniref:helix-turn-helix domain-containing protein n=1 Tax=Vibrio TaxID=662 RepID=UPI000635F8A9|nr:MULTISPECIES: AraC family transcriptional regulator [Vibrio]MCK8077116.1 AraC family transcriptional regulator [Vibrio sp. 1CM2L]CDT89751.1 conserved hypothetical protein [Vibrio coralliirubri]